MTPRILFIEDDELVAESLRMTFAHTDHQSFAATNHRDAFEILRTKPIDLILYSLDLFRYGGPEFFRTVKSDPHILPVAIGILSRTPEVEAAAMFREAGLDLGTCVRAYLYGDSWNKRLRNLIETLYPPPQQVVTGDDRKEPALLFESAAAKPEHNQSSSGLVQVSLALSSDDPEWPRFLTRRCELRGSVRRFPPPLKRIKSWRGSMIMTVFVDRCRFVEAVTGYEQAFDRKALVKNGAAKIGIEEISNGCTVWFQAPDADQSIGG